MGLPPPSPSGTCIVTGASSGIGAEIARELARRGRGVTLVARRVERLEALATELSEAHRVRTEVIPADLTDEAARPAIVDAVREHGLTVDVLVNNAGLSTTGPAAGAERQAELTMLRTNVEALVDLTVLCLPAMMERGSGGVINVASTAAYQPLPGQAGYAATKAFVLTYSLAVHAEVKKRGVTVTALCPGPVKTEFGDVAGFGDTQAKVPEFIWVPAEEVAKAALDGLDAGRKVVIPGMLNRVGSVAATLTPRTVLLPILAKGHPSLRH